MTYLAVYDAVRQSLGKPDVAGVIDTAVRAVLDVSGHKEQLRQAISGIESDMRRPFVLLRPKMFIDGDQWCAMYGDNVHDGVCGFGNTPDEASWEFDKAWYASKALRTEAVQDKQQ